MLAEIAHTFAIAREPSTDSTAVTDKLNSGRHIAVIEGPTGVGKSLAYLLAGMVMALSRGKKLIVSSATIALQEQLVNRDLPTLIEHSELDVSYALAKGRGRYLCPYRLHQMTGQDTAAADSPLTDSLPCGITSLYKVNCPYCACLQNNFKPSNGQVIAMIGLR